MEDKTLLKYVYFAVALAVGFVLVTVIVDDNNEIDNLKHQTSVQQSTIEHQRRELDRVEQTNVALVDQANSKSGE
ncbi:hypothetical protein D3P96_02860 [Weissella viridescens]|uniref:Uncharacterized protein n=1 Tax=Weissella viridescens TaxID=1629 RepID=A0A3P2RFI5_WEIVI|nr:hypothetical protein [Weissella viridescens]RRG18245.1 hypothetical protein D3P96_02860 [Weissella viridescens]